MIRRGSDKRPTARHIRAVMSAEAEYSASTRRERRAVVREIRESFKAEAAQ